jgi:hypothetical protein
MAFPTAYHIKVAVKDSRSVWLSSGNFNSSNQPALDPTDEDALREAARTNDRDWHVICESKELARVFRKYLVQDYTTANAAVAPRTAALAAAAPAELEFDIPAVAAHAPKSFFPAHKVSGKIKVKPLLTPDDYRQPVLDLIKSAKRSFFMQTQYIHTIESAKDTKPPFRGPSTWS